MLWQKDEETRPPLAWVAQTRRGHGYLRKPDESIALIIDFEGPALRKLPADAPVQGVVTADCEHRDRRSERVSQRRDGRMAACAALQAPATTRSPVEMRAFLRNGGTTLSETWSYILPIN